MNKKFSELSIGDKFGCWGDIHLNYSIPIWCNCEKIDNNTAKEIDGINFSMNDNDEVTIKRLILNKKQ